MDSMVFDLYGINPAFILHLDGLIAGLFQIKLIEHFPILNDFHDLGIRLLEHENAPYNPNQQKYAYYKKRPFFLFHIL